MSDPVERTPKADAPDANGARWVVAAITLAAFGLYALVGVVRYNTGRAANFDLGIFSQSAKAWSQGGPPASAIRDAPNLFADHFSPITALFGLAWRIWPDPRALILTQALALSLGVGIIAWAWVQLLGRRWAPVLVLIVLGRQILTAAYFDVHEVGLGMPAMALLAAGLALRRPRLIVLGAVVLLLTKEDLGLTVAAAGAVWWLFTRSRRFALALIALGIGGVLFGFVVIFLASGQRSIYLASLLGDGANPLGFDTGLPTGGSRWAPLALFVISAGVIGLRSPIALLAVPTLGWRLISSNPAYWQTYFHYDVMLAPIAAIALAETVSRWRARQLPDGERDAVRTRHPLIVPLAMGLALVSLGAAAWGGIDRIRRLPYTDRASYRLAPALRDALELTAQIPHGEAVAVEQTLGPPLVARLDVRMLSTASPVSTRWVLMPIAGSHLGAPEQSKVRYLSEVGARAGVNSWLRNGVVLVQLPQVEPVQLPH